jgi:alcohol dehydrogenase, propanol-preferring
VLCSPDESRQMMDFVAAHDITPRVVVFQGLESVGELMETVESGKVQGKAVIAVDNTQL